jgi:hypothetical protein
MDVIHRSDALDMTKTRKVSARALSRKVCVVNPIDACETAQLRHQKHRQRKQSLRAEPLDQEHRFLEGLI